MNVTSMVGIYLGGYRRCAVKCRTYMLQRVRNGFKWHFLDGLGRLPEISPLQVDVISFKNLLSCGFRRY